MILMFFLFLYSYIRYCYKVILFEKVLYRIVINKFFNLFLYCIVDCRRKCISSVGDNVEIIYWI